MNYYSLQICFTQILVRRLSLSLRPNSVLWPRKLASLIIWIWLNWRRNMRLASLGIWANCHCIPMCLKCLRILAMLPIRPGATWAQRLFWKMIKMISYIYPCKFAIRSEPQGAAFVWKSHHFPKYPTFKFAIRSGPPQRVVGKIVPFASKWYQTNWPTKSAVELHHWPTMVFVVSNIPTRYAATSRLKPRQIWRLLRWE